jgi:hypothetical protein
MSTQVEKTAMRRTKGKADGCGLEKGEGAFLGVFFDCCKTLSAFWGGFGCFLFL